MVEIHRFNGESPKEPLAFPQTDLHFFKFKKSETRLLFYAKGVFLEIRHRIEAEWVARLSK